MTKQELWEYELEVHAMPNTREKFRQQDLIEMARKSFELEAVRKELDQVKDELDDYREQVSSLENRLSSSAVCTE